jgi:hypothetical protein
MAMVEDISNGMDMETINSSKNITDPITIELFRKIAKSKKSKIQSSIMMCAQATTSTSLKQPFSSSHEEVIKVVPQTPTLDVVKEPMVHPSMEPPSMEQMVHPSMTPPSIEPMAHSSRHHPPQAQLLRYNLHPR